MQIIRKNLLDEIPFDSKVKHIEDMIWAQKLSDLNYYIGYLKEATVTHYHGINQW